MPVSQRVGFGELLGHCLMAVISKAKDIKVVPEVVTRKSWRVGENQNHR